MKVFEFESSIDDKGNLKIPHHLINIVPKNKNLRAMIFIEEDDKLWKNLVKEQFFAGYYSSDSIYDSENK